MELDTGRETPSSISVWTDAALHPTDHTFLPRLHKIEPTSGSDKGALLIDDNQLNFLAQLFSLGKPVVEETCRKLESIRPKTSEIGKMRESMSRGFLSILTDLKNLISE